MGTAHINARCTEAQKEQYGLLARRFGYSSFSEFLIELLDSMVNRYGTEGWESHLVHVVGRQIVATSSEQMDDSSVPTAAFPIVAPARFWRYLERDIIDDEQSEPSEPP